MILGKPVICISNTSDNTVAYNDGVGINENVVLGLRRIVSPSAYGSATQETLPTLPKVFYHNREKLSIISPQGIDIIGKLCYTPFEEFSIGTLTGVHVSM